MKQFSGILAISLLSCATDASAVDQLGAIGVQNPFTEYYEGHSNAAGLRPIVPSAVIETEISFFQGTGDGSAGDWSRP